MKGGKIGTDRRVMADRRSNDIITFCHIPKTAGTTLQMLLRRHFGRLHLDVAGGTVYSHVLLARDLRLNPKVRSLAGHPLRPFADYGDYADRLLWYTFLREPVARCISHYQHAVEKHQAKRSFRDWMRDTENWNWHVRFLSGGQDLSAARQILEERMRFVGLTERFDESLLLLRERLELRDFAVAYGRPRNTARTGEVRRRVQASFDEYRDEVTEHNLLDLELYDHVTKELYPRQVKAYGQQRLEADLETKFSPRRSTLSERFRYYESAVFRKLYYLPMVRFGKGLGRRGDGAVDAPS